MLTYRLEFSLEITRESILPEFDLLGELSHGNPEGLGSNMNVLGTKLVCKMDER